MERNVAKAAVPTKEEAMTDARKTGIILKRTSSALVLLLLLCACNGTLLHSFYRVDGEWARYSAAEFTYSPYYSPCARCGIRVEVRTDASYRYKNLVVRAEYRNMKDSLMACDTIPIMVYGDDGHRIGATAGILYQQESSIISPDVAFRDSVNIRLYHLMPDEMLKGVHDIGIKLTRFD